MVGTSFGMARYGYGLLLPDIRAAYRLSSGELGLIGAGSSVAYLAATAVAAVIAKAGARGAVMLGGTCATAGMLLAGLSRSPWLLAAGLLLAGASAGLVYPPFSDIVQRDSDRRRRGRVMSAISSGTGWGVAIAAPVAIVLGGHWRVAWLVFAAIAAAATIWALRVLPPGRAHTARLPRLRPRWFVCRRSAPLLAGAILVGLASAVYWTFAVDLVRGAGALSVAESSGFLAVVGVASAAGVVAGDATLRLGAAPTYVAAVAAEALALVLLALAPGALALAALSAVLFGLGYNVALTLQALWSTRVFANRPSAGLAGVMFLNSAGLLIAPPIAGVLADGVGMRAVFAGATALLAAAALLRPPRDVLDRD
jgi:predicted MFS family arabinose efflux permease